MGKIERHHTIVLDPNPEEGIYTVTVTALPDVYFDEDVREREAAASFAQALEALKTLVRLRVPVAVFSDASSFHTPRQTFFHQLVKSADQVWRFAEQEGGKLTLVEEKALMPPRALASYNGK